MRKEEEEPGRGRRCLRGRRRNKKRTIKKGMSVVALLKTHLSLFTYYEFTCFQMDEGCRKEDADDDN